MEFIQAIDLWLFHIFNTAISNSIFDKLMPFITEQKNWNLVYIFLIGWLLWKGGAKGRICAFALLIGVGISNEISSHFLKNLIERPRPCHSLENLRLLVDCGPGKSFPSSHAVNNFVMAGILSYFYKEYKIVLFILATMVAFSRVYVGVHYPFDSIGGALIGLFLAAIYINILHPIRFEFEIRNSLRF